jgi:monofunctional glycosyltransferase
MQAYLNIAEWGDDIYGAEAASRAHFAKPAKQLTAREAALLATSLPNPLERDPRRPTRLQRALTGTILARMESAEPWLTCLR